MSQAHARMGIFPKLYPASPMPASQGISRSGATMLGSLFPYLLHMPRYTVSELPFASSQPRSHACRRFTRKAVAVPVARDMQHDTRHRTKEPAQAACRALARYSSGSGSMPRSLTGTGAALSPARVRAASARQRTPCPVSVHPSLPGNPRRFREPASNFSCHHACSALPVNCLRSEASTAEAAVEPVLYFLPPG